MTDTITRNLRLSFPKDLVKEPVVSDVIKKYEVTANIRRADVDANGGWLILGLVGSPETLDKVTEYMTKRGVLVSDVEMEMN